MEDTSHSSGDASGLPSEDDLASGEDEVTPAARAPRAARRPHFRDRQRGWLTRSLAPQGSTPDTEALDATALPEEEQQEDDALVASEPVAPEPAPARRRTAAPRRQQPGGLRRQRGLIAILLGVILLAVLIGRLSATSSSGAPPAATPLPTAPPFTPNGGAALAVIGVLGASAGLHGPMDAAQLANGHLAVADTGDSRLVVLDAGGHLLSAIRHGAGAIQQPYAVAADPTGFYMLDSGRGTIEHYRLDGGFDRLVIQNPAELVSARGMALGPDGNLYVANPRTNSIDVFAPAGTRLHHFSSPTLGSGPNDWNQPSDVTVGSGGTIYGYDDVNNRIKAINSSGTLIGQWSAPASYTTQSVRLLALPDGRLVATDPNGGALLVYPALNGGIPTSFPLHIQGKPTTGAGHLQPFGLTRLHDGDLLIADGAGNRLCVVPVPS